jgi:hypothetical protein
LAEAQTRVERALAASGARLAHLQVEADDHAEYLIRVPSDQLDALMDSVAALGKVEARAVGAVDVTDPVIDAQARLDALRGSRDRLRQLLERAGTVQDVIAVERELARVQGEVESLDARLNALRSQIALSDLAVRLERRLVLGPLGALIHGLGVVVGKLFVWR